MVFFKNFKNSFILTGCKTKSWLFFFFLFWVAIFSKNLSAQTTSSFELLPKGSLFKALYLDPNEAQAYGSITTFSANNTLFADTVYVPFGFGFFKGLVRWNKKHPVEIGMTLSAHVQFQWTFDEGKFTRDLQNTDYKAGLLVNYQISNFQQMRFRLFHVSSHPGDDFLIKNQVTTYFVNPNNYEQLDVFYSQTVGVFRLYGGLGLVIRPNTIRDRFSFAFGSTFDKPLKTSLPLGFIGGVNIKFLEQNSYNPGMKIGAGLRLGKREKKPLKFIFEYYLGNLPYSPYENRHVQWLGLGLYFSPN